MNFVELSAALEQFVAANCEPSSMTVAEWADTWYKTYVENRDITVKSVAMYREKLKNHILPYIGEKKLSEITEIDLQNVLNKANSSKSTAQKTKIVLQAMFRKASKLNLIYSDPSEDLTIPKAPSGSHRSITDEERAEILALAETHHAGRYVLLILFAGLRPQEAIVLRWRDIDFENRSITIHQALESGMGYKIKNPKSAAGKRTVPLCGYLYERLLQNRGEDTELVFRQPLTGKPHTHSSINDLWNNFKRALDIQMGAKRYRNKITETVVADDLVPYCLRHTYCTDLQRAGVPINVARYLMGHSDISITSKIYTSTTPDVVWSANKSMEAFYKDTYSYLT